MESSALDSLLVSPGDSIRRVMQCIDENAKGIALVVDVDRRLVDTVTDGDIRRAILAGLRLDAPVRRILERKAETSGRTEPVSASAGSEKGALIKLMKEHVVRQIPLLDDEGRVVDLVRMDDLLPQDVLPLQAVVMAGGFGTRLRPLTEDVPKPMLPVGDRPLLERIVERLRDSHISRVNITTHYKPEKITEHFGDGTDFGVQLTYVSEEQPLGTAGALSLMEAPEEPLLVMNGDILTEVNFRAMLAFHHEHQADLTVAVRQYDLEVPYGVLECDGPRVQRLREKPTASFLVNAGIYLLDPSVHGLIPAGRRYDMTDLIEQLVEDGGTVVSFPVVEYWLDIGQHDDYVRAQDDLENGVVR